MKERAKLGVLLRTMKRSHVARILHVTPKTLNNAFCGNELRREMISHLMVGLEIVELQKLVCG